MGYSFPASACADAGPWASYYALAGERGGKTRSGSSKLGSAADNVPAGGDHGLGSANKIFSGRTPFASGLKGKPLPPDSDSLHYWGVRFPQE